MQKPVIECYIIERFMGTIVEWHVYGVLVDAIGGMPILRQSTQNLR